HRDALDSVLADWTGPRPAIAGVHGQTVLHRRPANGVPGATLQIIDAPGMADALQMPVVFDFRSADIAAGGEGAPLAPVYHRALLDRSQLEKSAVVNLGGVANVTFCEADTPLIAFDTGPANGPIDEWIAGHGLGVRDEDGRLAASGRVHRGHLDQILDHVYFDEPPPKSLDRYDFNANLVRGLSPADGAATLTALCAESLARAFEHAAVPVDRIVLCGGGRHNPALVSAIEAAVPCRVVSAEAVGWRGDSIEAEAFAYLAVRSMRGLPISFSGTTGVPDPLSGGQMIEPRSMPI
ncbi:MAG: anhydro-N-acetylmuramic acid kinase, partial [Pseudomonadota bacterium]